MPRSVDQILAHADELAEKFEKFDPSVAQEVDTRILSELRAAAQERATAELHILEAVQNARQDGLSWNTIGTFLGTSGEAVRQKYSPKVA